MILCLLVIATCVAAAPQRGIIYQQPSFYYTNTLDLDVSRFRQDVTTLATHGIANVGLRISIGDLIPAFNFTTGTPTYDEVKCAKLGALAGIAAAHGMQLIFNTHLSEHVPVGTPNSTLHKSFTDGNGVVHPGTLSTTNDLMVRPDAPRFVLAFHTKCASCLAANHTGVKYWKHSFESTYLFPSAEAAESPVAAAKFAQWAQDTNASLGHWATRWGVPLSAWSDIRPPTAAAGNKPFVGDWFRFWLLGVLKTGRYGISIGAIRGALAKGAGGVFSPLVGYKHWKPTNFDANTDLTHAELVAAYDLPINVTALGYYVHDAAGLAAEPAAVKQYVAAVKALAPPHLPLLMWESGASTFQLSQEESATWAQYLIDTAAGTGLEGFNWWQWIDWSPSVGAPDKEVFHFGCHDVNGTAKLSWSVLSQ